MTTYVALLRAVNLGSRNKVSMAELRTLFLGLGCAEVETYVQSGNVVFASRARGAAELTRSLEEEIERRLGLRLTVLLLTRAELADVVAANPFAAGGAEPGKLHVTFLAEAPDGDRAAELEAREFPPDELRVVGREVYLHCPDGYGRSKLSNVFLERQLGVAGTTRGWRTVTRLLELADARADTS